MGRLSYSVLASLDGYVADAAGGFDWAAPDEQVHAFINDLERPVGSYLYGRRMYEVMQFWQDADGPSAVSRDYAAIWQAADKVVYSRTLSAVTTPRTRVERSFDPAAVRDAVSASRSDVSIGGPGLAAHAILAGLVDDYHLFLTPVVVGGGTRALPDGARLRLELVGKDRFDGGVVHLHYRAAG